MKWNQDELGRREKVKDRKIIHWLFMILISLFNDSLFTIVNCVYPLYIVTRSEKRDM